MRLNNSHVINELYQFNYKDINMHALDLDLTSFLNSLENCDDIFYYDNNLYILDYYATGVNYKVNLETKEIVQLTYTFDSDVLLNGYYDCISRTCGNHILIIESPDYDAYNVHLLTLGEDIIDTPISIISDKGYGIYDIYPDIIMTDVYNDDILYFSCRTDAEGKLNDIMYKLDTKKGTIESMNINIEEEAKDLPGTFEFAYISHGRLKVVFRIDKYFVFYEYAEALNRFNEIDRIIATYTGYGFTHFKNNHIILNYRLNEYIGILVYDLHTHEKYLTPRMANSLRDVWFIDEGMMVDNDNDGHIYRLEKCDKAALDNKADKSELFSGDYNDLENKPVYDTRTIENVVLEIDKDMDLSNYETKDILIFPDESYYFKLVKLRPAYPGDIDNMKESGTLTRGEETIPIKQAIEIEPDANYGEGVGIMFEFLIIAEDEFNYFPGGPIESGFWMLHSSYIIDENGEHVEQENGVELFDGMIIRYDSLSSGELRQLDEKFIPDDFKNYNKLINKPCYDLRAPEIETSIVFDGDTTGKETVLLNNQEGELLYTLVKMADEPISFEEFYSASLINITSSDGEEYLYDLESGEFAAYKDMLILKHSDDLFYVDQLGIFVACKTSNLSDIVNDYWGECIVTPGIWFKKDDETFISKLVYKRFTDKTESNFKQLDKKFIPESIATKEYVDQSISQVNEDLQNQINELFQNVSSGKELIASAITDKGVDASEEETFQSLSEKINQIPVGPPGSNIIGYINENNDIYVSLTELESGTYTLKFEDYTGLLNEFDDIGTVEV